MTDGLRGAPSPVPLSALLAEAPAELVAAVLEQGEAAIRMQARDGVVATSGDVARVRQAASRLARGMPLAYAVGTAAFRHLLLHVDERVLIPRPETELLVDHVLRLTADAPGGTAIDVGTGSGAIALALAQEGRFGRIIATDISTDALAVARCNAGRCADLLRAPVEFRQGSDLTPCEGVNLRAQVVVSNPPYVAYREAPSLPSLVRDWEPPTALFAPDEGQARYRALIAAAPRVLEVGGWLVLECDSARAQETAALARAHGAFGNVEVHDDLTGRPRVLVARLRDAAGS